MTLNGKGENLRPCCSEYEYYIEKTVYSVSKVI